MVHHAVPFRSHRASARGFTLIELLVVTGIIVVITGVVLANNSRFGGVVTLENLTYDVALTIRQAQVYGISVARFGTNTFTAGYGVDFNLSSPGTYAMFADAISANGLYDCPSPGTSDCELVQSVTLNQGYRISDLCVTSSSGTETCYSTSSSPSHIDVLFKRPEPDAWISADGASCILVPPNGPCQASARIVITSPRGDVASVVVEDNGQISVRRSGT